MWQTRPPTETTPGAGVLGKEVTPVRKKDAFPPKAGPECSCELITEVIQGEQ